MHFRAIFREDLKKIELFLGKTGNKLKKAKWCILEIC